MKITILAISTIILLCLLLIGSVTGCKKEEQIADNLTPTNCQVLAKTTILSTIENLAYTDPLSQSQSIQPKIVFAEHGHGVAYLAQIDGKYQVVHNGKAGKPNQQINHLVVSPDGRRVAYDILVNDKRSLVLDGREGPLFSDVWLPSFSPDSRHISYIAQIDDKSFIVVDDTVSSKGYPSFNDTSIFSGNSANIVVTISPFSNNKTQVIVSDIQLKNRIAVECAENGVFITNRDRSRIAVIRPTAKGQQVVVVDIDSRKIVSEGASYESIEKISFTADGFSEVYTATRGSNRYIVAHGKEELLPEAIATGMPASFGEKGGVGLFLLTKSGVSLYQAFTNKGFIGSNYDEAALLVYDSTGSQYAHVARKGKEFFVVVNGKRTITFDMVQDPLFSPDGKYIVFSARTAGKRFTVVADSTANIIRQNPPYEFVYQKVFTADGKAIAYGVKDGNQLIWKVESL